jgi:DNA polymerase epsilon subunit 3
MRLFALRAHDVASSKQHKSISASDVLKALEIIEFGDLNDMLQSELQSAFICRLQYLFNARIDLNLCCGIVYRNNMKNDKAKKERAEKAAATASAKGKAKEIDPAANANASSASASMSISAAPKSKGKPPTPGSAPVSPTISTSISAPGAMLPPPFTSAPRMPPMPMDAEPSSQSELQPQPEPQILRGDNDEMDVEEGVEDEDVEVDVDVHEANEEGEGAEEVQDMMAVEEEIKRDAKGLEEKIGDD